MESSVLFHINKLCGDCCDVTIVMGSLWPCPCNDSTSVYMFKLNGTLAIAMHGLLHNNLTYMQYKTFTFWMCVDYCCELCNISHKQVDSGSETDMTVIIIMATIIVILLTLVIVIFLAYQW